MSSDLVSRSGSLYLPFGGRQTPWSVGAKAYTRVETVTRTPCSSRSAFVLLVQVVVHRTPCSSRSAFVLLVQVVVLRTPCSSRSAFVLLVQVVVHSIPRSVVSQGCIRVESWHITTAISPRVVDLVICVFWFPFGSRPRTPCLSRVYLIPHTSRSSKLSSSPSRCLIESPWVTILA